MADLQLFDRTKTGLSLLPMFFSGVLKLICCLLSDFSSHIDSFGSTAPTGFELIVISMMMIICSHRQAGRPLTPSDNSAPIYEPSLPPTTARAYQLCHPHHDDYHVEVNFNIDMAHDTLQN